MDLDELKKLIPFYVAGTLDDAEKSSVEDALGKSRELVEDLHFWQGAQRETLEREAYEALGHPTSQAIVDYAEGLLKVVSAGIVRRHLSACSECQDEFDMVAASLGLPRPQLGLKEYFGDMVDRLRQWFQVPSVATRVVPALVGAMAIILVAISVLWTPPGHLSMRLSYEAATRTGSTESLPVLKLAEDTRFVEFAVEIPRAAVVGTRYSVYVMDSANTTREFSGSYETSNLNDQFDLIEFTLDRSEFFLLGGFCVMTIVENLPAESDLTPERYVYRIEVQTIGSSP